MTLLINNDVTRRVLEMDEAVEAIEDAFTQVGEKRATFQPRTDVVSPTSERGDCYAWGSMIGAISEPPRLAFRFKSDNLVWRDTDHGRVEKKFNVEPGTFMGFVLLVDTSDGSLIGLLNDGELQHVRVGATAGVACDRLAREDAETVGMIGSGGMARTYLEAFDVVRDLSSVEVFSPTEAHREEYAAEMTDTLGIEVTPVESPKEAVNGADIVSVCTDARNPVYKREWLEDGVFVVNTREDEVEEELFEAADVTAKTDNGAFSLYAIEDESFGPETYLSEREAKWFEPSDYPTLPEILTGDAPGREHDDQSIFYDNISSAVQFAAVGNLVHERATDRDLGTPVPLEWFQQDIRD